MAARPDPFRSEPSLPRPAVLDQHWCDVTFIHWPVHPDSVAVLYTPRVRPALATASASERCQVEEHLVAADQPLADDHHAHTVALDYPVTIGNDGVPIVQEPSGERSRPGVDLNPVEVAGQESTKVGRNLAVTEHPVWHRRVAVERVVGIERVLGSVPRE